MIEKVREWSKGGGEGSLYRLFEGCRAMIVVTTTPSPPDVEQSFSYSGFCIQGAEEIGSC